MRPSALALAALLSPAGAFSPPPRRQLQITTSYPDAPSSSSTVPSTAVHALQPGKGGIVVEAKSDFVARDILIDAMMGRDGDGGDSNEGGQQPEFREVDDLNIKPNEEAWVFDFSKPKTNAAAPPMSPPPPPKQTKQAQPSRAARASDFLNNPPPPPPPPQPTSSSETSKLPDPSVMKLDDLRGELALRRIPHDDCFDREGLEAKLREGRAAMRAARRMEGGSRRNAVGGGGGVGAAVRAGSSVIGESAPRQNPVAARAVVATATATRSARSSAAEQAVFSSSSTERVGFAARSSTTTRTATRTATRTRTASASSNPFGRAGRRPTPNTRNTGGGNSSASFRDAAGGIGFGDANSYTSSSNPGSNRSFGTNFGSSGGGGDGVRLGKSRTSYGEFNGGSSVGGDFGTSAGGSNVGGANAAFRSGGAGSGGNFGNGGGSVSGGGSTSTFSSGGGGGGSGSFGGGSFNAGGVSIKGDSSIFSSMGMMGGQGGGTTTFSGGGGAGTAARVPPRAPPSTPRPPADEPELDWLVQAAPAGEDPVADAPDFGDAAYDLDAYDATDGTTDDDEDDCSAVASHYDTSAHGGRPVSRQYSDEGLDALSGGRDGFGAVQGVVKGSGDGMAHRGSANDVNDTSGDGSGPARSGGGRAGDQGVSLGGDFGASQGSSIGGFGAGRSSARYSDGRGGAFHDDYD